MVNSDLQREVNNKKQQVIVNTETACLNAEIALDKKNNKAFYSISPGTIGQKKLFLGLLIRLNLWYYFLSKKCSINILL